ncbi:MAG: FKBP-type peptidyl-prolyl cis-trans isomerase [Clostridia bacterium]|nr:FKBP-type peptidyl-prolyl cis-trans isomerase [Clostridia bacterium]
MKKKISILLILVMVLSLLTFTACGKEEEKKEESVKLYKGPYDSYTLSDYVDLTDYSKYEYSKPVGTATDADVEKAVDELLLKYPNVTIIENGPVGLGDAVTISFDGVLEDGTTVNGMSSDKFDMVLGETSMIDGFTESIIGKNIGEVFAATMKFPDPYPNNMDLSGKGVTFTIKVLKKTVSEKAELTDEWVAKNTDLKTVAELKESLKKDLEKADYDEKLDQIKGEILQNILADSSVKELIKDKIAEETELYNKLFHAMAKAYNLEWKDFLEQYLEIAEDEYDLKVAETINQLVKGDMIAYALCQKEGITVPQSEIDNYCQYLLVYYGIDAKTFEEGMGLTPAEYMHYNGYEYQCYVSQALDKLAEKIIK